MPLDLITYTDKTNLVAPQDVTKQATAEDFNEIKDVVNAAVNALNGSSLSSMVYVVYLPSAGTVADRIAAAVAGVDYPLTWVLTPGSSAVDINIAHSLTRRVATVTVFAVDGDEEQQLFNTAAYNGIKTPDVDNLLVQSLATIAKRIGIYIIFK